MTKTPDKIFDRNLIMQMIVLSIGFALVISWETAIQPRLLAVIILILLVLIYPMPERLNLRIIELVKLHGMTHTLLMEIRHFVIGKSGYENIAMEELVSRVDQWADQLEKFDEVLEEDLKLKREISGADPGDFFFDALNMAFYLFILIGASALIGWLVSLAF